MRFLIPFDKPIQFEYINHRGKIELRNVFPYGLDYGENEWYPQPQWFVRCWDYDKESERSFALLHILTGTVQVMSAARRAEYDAKILARQMEIVAKIRPGVEAYFR